MARADGSVAAPVSQSAIQLRTVLRIPEPITPLRTESATISPAGGKLQLGNARLHIPAESLAAATRIEIQQLAKDSLPPIPAGLVNVTEDGAGYRFLPEGQAFKGDIAVTLPLRMGGTASYWKALGVRTYRWEAQLGRWEPLDSAAVQDESVGPMLVRQSASPVPVHVESKTRRFSIFINAVLKAPDHPGPANFNENAISSIGAGDPAANVDLIAPPEINSFGAATVSFPMRLPQGRGAYTPQLGLSYSSEASNGPLGVGWDLPVSRIAIDDRNGVPRYDGSDHPYVLDGVRLIKRGGTATPCLRKPATLIAEFAARVHSDQRIALCSGANGRYWEVVRPDGVRFYYGVSSSARLKPDSDTREEKVAAWMLEEVEDPNGNLTKYLYQRESQQLYLTQIDYTSHLGSGTAPAYRVVLNWDWNTRSARPDKPNSARFGFLVKTQRRLESVGILVRLTGGQTSSLKPNDRCYRPSADGLSAFTGVRCYELEYTSSKADSKSLLQKVSVRGSAGEAFYEHSLDYTQAEGTQSAFENRKSWSQPSNQQALTDPARRLEDTDEENHQLDLSVGVSVGVCSLTGSFGLGYETPEPTLQLIDVDGDGIPDRMWKGAVSGQPGVYVALGSGQTNFSDPKGTREITQIGAETAMGGNVGGGGGCGIMGAGVSASASVSLRAASRSAMLVDMDGDGLVDLLHGDTVYRGLPGRCRDGKAGTETEGVCPNDGLLVCSKMNALCFVEQRDRSLPSAQLPTDAPRAVDASGLNAQERAASSKTAAKSGSDATLKPESDWGPYTAARRRMEAEGTSAASFDPIRTVIRWDAQHDGDIQLKAKFALRSPSPYVPHSVKVTVLKVTDPHSDRGTSRPLYERSLGALDPDGVWSNTFTLSVRFRESILFVFESLESDSVTSTGVLLDQVKAEIEITYVKVCPLGASACRDVTDELGHIGPTGLPAYVYRYPADFRISELPREAYWQLLPPLGPPVRDADGRLLTNQVVLKIQQRVAFALSPIHVRVRCESMASQRGGDGHVCPLGTVLRDFVLDGSGTKGQDVERTLVVPLPEPFMTVPRPDNTKPPESIASCKALDHSSLKVSTRLAQPSRLWTISDKLTSPIVTLASKFSADLFMATARHFKWVCYTPGPSATPQHHEHVILHGRIKPVKPVKPTVSWSEIRSSADCTSYVPTAARFEQLGMRFVLKSGPTLLWEGAGNPKQAEATWLSRLAQSHEQLCSIGRDNPVEREEHSAYVVQYFDGPERKMADPTRILVEVDGEDGVEIPTSAVAVSAQMEVVSMRSLQQERLLGTGPFMTQAEEVRTLAGRDTLRAPVRTLYRVHPSRQLRAFRAEAGQELSILATVVRHKFPVYLSVTGDQIAEKWSKRVSLDDAHAGATAVTGTYTYTIPKAGFYYLRGYTEASFDPQSAVHVAASISCPPHANDCTPDVPVNLLQADFGYTFLATTDPETRAAQLDTLRLKDLVGEVPHSFEPFSGGHHGFFYGFYRGDAVPKCVNPYGCTSDDHPHPLQSQFSRQGSWTVAAAPAGFHSRSRLNQGLAMRDASGDRAIPQERDRDGDGIINGNDQCPDDPEDFVGDQDGCPDQRCQRDSDGDGLPDCYDMCPFQPADAVAGVPFDGCPRGDNSPHDPPVSGGNPTGGETGCYASADGSATLCGNGTSHPSHANSTGGASQDDGDEDFSIEGLLGIDGFRRTWVFGRSAQFGASLFVVGADVSIADAAQYTDRDLMDWDGDGIPDRVSPNLIVLGGKNRSIALSDLACYLPGPEGQCLIYPGVHESASQSAGYGLSIGPGRGALAIKTTPEGVVKDQSQSSSETTLGITASMGAHAIVNQSQVISQRIDINGDGLPDQVLFRPDGRLRVRLNLGDSLVDNDSFKVEHGIHEIGASEGFTRSEEWGGGADVYFVGGSYYERNGNTLTQTKRQLVDVNGDGLPDLVTIKPLEDHPRSEGSLPRKLEVRFNLGDSFATSPVALDVPFWDPKIDATPYTTGILGEAADNVDRYPDALAISSSDTHGWSGQACARFIVTACTAYSHSQGHSSEWLQLRDMDGDGVVDRVLRTGAENGAIQVQRGQLGGANLLKRIEGPLGGAIELQYERRMPTEDSPRPGWNLKQVTVRRNSERFANYPPEGDSPAMVQTIAYESPYFDRYEREFLGYAKVRITRALDNRVVERQYENRDFWLKGSLLAERVLDAQGKLLREDTFTYDTQLLPSMGESDRQACLEGLLLPQRYLKTPKLRDAHKTPCDAKAPRLTFTASKVYEGSESAVTYSRAIPLDQYDTYGNPLKVVETIDGANEPSLTTSVTYDSRPTLLKSHIVTRATAVAARTNAAAPALRHRAAIYDDRGNLKRHEVWADENGTRKATLDLTVDALGFVTNVVDANGYLTTLTPDTLTHSLPVAITDSFELTSAMAYDYRNQQLTSSTDPNGNTIARTYDAFGRLWKVRGPYEAAANLESIEVAYGPISGEGPVRALTTNRTVDPDTKQAVATLRVARFSDWLGRTVQVQTESSVDGQQGRTISGRVEFDGAGRQVRLGEPVFVGNVTSFAFHRIVWDEGQNLCRPSGPKFCTTTTFDALDRPLVTTTPKARDANDAQGGLRTEQSYSLARHPRDGTRWVLQTQVTDPAGKVRRLFHDSLDRLVAVVEMLDGRELKTTYDYSAIDDLLALTDARGNRRSFEYDTAGRRTAVVTPDTGRLEMAYDAMGNLVQQTDQELCTAGAPLLSNPACQSRIVRRTYDRNRLTGIDYPTSPDVVFVYGDNDTLGRCSGLANTRGRACWTQDGAGTERRAFGALGETTSQERALPLFEGSTESISYTTRFRHDSFGRMLWLEYPDGERLTYTYDAGARVQAALGVRGQLLTSYLLDRRYDVYGKPLSTVLGNGVSESNQYEPETQRLSHRRVRRGDLLLADLELVYDPASNIVFSITQRNEGHAVSRLERGYTYDDLHRLYRSSLLGKAADATTALAVNGEYLYDDVGNITRQTLTATGTASDLARDWNYAYATPARPNLPDTIGPRSFVYDARGAVKRITDLSGAMEMSWDELGRLQSVIGPSATSSSYRYDAGGARQWRATNSTSSEGAVTTLFHYPNPYYTAGFSRTVPDGCTSADCSTLTAARTKHIRVDGQTMASVVGFVQSGYAGPELSVPYVTTAANYLHSDQVRSTVVVTGSSGATERAFEYLPNGQIVAAASTPEPGGLVSFQSFAGIERDPYTGWSYFGARDYAPQWGRWLSSDPLALRQPQESQLLLRLSTYAYALNNPLRYRDPTGLAPVNVQFRDGKSIQANLVSSDSLGPVSVHFPNGRRVQADLLRTPKGGPQFTSWFEAYKWSLRMTSAEMWKRAAQDAPEANIESKLAYVAAVKEGTDSRAFREAYRKYLEKSESRARAEKADQILWSVYEGEEVLQYMRNTPPPNGPIMREVFEQVPGVGVGMAILEELGLSW
jgi:RHS repeat-associated protein